MFLGNLFFHVWMYAALFISIFLPRFFLWYACFIVGWGCYMMRLHCFVLVIDIGYSWCLNVEQLILELYAVCKPLVLLENTDNSRLIDCCLLYVAMPCYGMMLLEACFYELNILLLLFVCLLVGTSIEDDFDKHIMLFWTL